MMYLPTLKINWRDFLAPKLSIAANSKPHKTRMGDGCGITALSMLTGIHPNEFAKHRPHVDRDGMSDRAMKRTLRKLGYTIFTVTKSSVRKEHWSDMALRPDHCLLINGMIDPVENSWLVLHKNKLWHNFGVDPDFNQMYFLNKPTETVYLVWHPSWADSEKSYSYIDQLAMRMHRSNHRFSSRELHDLVLSIALRHK